MCLTTVFTSFFALCLTSPAVADDCSNLAENDEWGTNFKEMAQLYKDGQLRASLNKAEDLQKICPKSPILNYTMAQIYRKLGDNTRATQYVLQATDYTKEFAVSDEILKMIWYERYEIEHKEARQEVIEGHQKEIEEREKIIQELSISNDKTKERIAQRQMIEIIDAEKEKHHYAAGLWTGVGTAGLGLALIGGATFFILTNNDDTIKFEKNDEGLIDPKTKGSNNAYWGILGAGIAATVFGGIISGIFGYYYAQSNADKKGASIAFCPTMDGIGIQF